MAYPRCVALAFHWLAWFLPLSAYGVYDMLNRPPMGHFFEYGPDGAVLAVFVSAIIATLYLPVVIATLLLLGKVEQTSKWPLVGFTSLAAWLSCAVFWAASFFPTDWLPNRTTFIFGLIAVFMIAVMTTATTILGAAKYGYIKRLQIIGICSLCGYDLRGTYGPKCPECGSPVIHTSKGQTASN